MEKNKNYIWEIEQGNKIYEMYSCSLSPSFARVNVMENLLGSNFIVETIEKLKKTVTEYPISFDCVIMNKFHDKNSLTTLFEVERLKNVQVLEIYEVGKTETCPLYNEIQDAFKKKYQDAFKKKYEDAFKKKYQDAFKKKYQDAFKKKFDFKLYIFFYKYERIENKRKKPRKQKRETKGHKREKQKDTKERNKRTQKRERYGKLLSIPEDESITDFQGKVGSYHKRNRKSS